MTNPGAQQDEQHAALSAKVAKLSQAMQGLRESLSAVERQASQNTAHIAANSADIADIKETIGTPPPEPDKPYFDLSGLPDTLTAGEQITVPCPGVPDGDVWLHNFDRDWKDPQRSTVQAIGERVKFDVPSRTGDRILQLQQGEGDDATKAHKEVVIEADVTVPPDILPPITSTDQLPMAQWNCVPLQDFRGEFQVGIIAHHSNGIERVEFRGGALGVVVIDSPSVNPRTGSEEYWFTTDADMYLDGPVQFTATVYPRSGKPREMPPLKLWANAGGTIDFPTYTIPAGTTTIPRIDCPTDRWLAIRQEDPSERAIFDWGTKGNVKFDGVRFQGKLGNMAAAAGKGAGRVWFNGTDYLGVESAMTPGKRLHELTTVWPVNYWWSRAYYTDCKFDHVANPLNSNYGIARNVHVGTCYEDLIRVVGLVDRVTCDRIVRGAPAGDWGYVHTDGFQIPNSLSNAVYQNITVKDAKAQGMSIGGRGATDEHFRDVAFVNIDVNVTTDNIGLRVMTNTHNVLLDNVRVRSPLGGELRDDIDNIVMRGVDPLPRGAESHQGVTIQ